MELDRVLERARKRCASPQDMETLREYLLSGGRDHDRVHAALTLYLDQGTTIDHRVVEKYLEFPDDPMLSAAVIFSAASRIGVVEGFWEKVVAIATGAAWDVSNCARVQALLALHHMPAGRVDVREPIRLALLSDWESVRDSAAIAAQRCFGRSEADVVADGPWGRLIECVGDDVLNWIWPDRADRTTP